MSHFPTSIFLTTSLSFCHSPSTVVRKAFDAVTVDFPGTQFCHSFARQPFRHCEHSEQGEPSDSELSPHASLISWQRRSMVVWQLKATLPSSQILEKERHHLARPILPNDFNGPALVVALIHITAQGGLSCRAKADSFRAFRTALPPNVSQVRRRTTTGPRFASCCQKV